MIKGRPKKSLGRISKTLLILIGIIVVAVVAIIAVITITRKPPPPPPEETEKEPELVYEVEVDDIKFKLEEAKDRGNILKVSESRYPQSQREDLVTTEKFIEVTISVQNIGKENIPPGWEVMELVDNEERKFYSSRETDLWIPEESECGALLKPGFTPTLCIKIYEVAKISTGLKVRVASKEKRQRKDGFFIDIGL